MKGNQIPVRQEEVIFRTTNQLELFDRELVNDTTPRLSSDVECAAFRKFGLYVYIDSTSTPTTLHIEVEFLNRWNGRWYTHKQGVFAALYYEDGDTASGIYECFVGDVVGRAIRVKLTGVGTTSTEYFIASILLDLWN